MAMFDNKSTGKTTVKTIGEFLIQDVRDLELFILTMSKKLNNLKIQPRFLILSVNEVTGLTITLKIRRTNRQKFMNKNLLRSSVTLGNLSYD
jgi:hypothetical protein